MAFNTGVIHVVDAAILTLPAAIQAGLQPDVATLDPVMRLSKIAAQHIQDELPHLQIGTSFDVQLQGALDADGYGNFQLNVTINQPSGGEGAAQ